MKKNIFIFLVAILAVILQTSVLPLCFSEGSVPDIALVFLVSGVSVFGFNAIWPWAVILGMILDVFSFRRIGTDAFSFIFFSYCVSFFSRRLILGEKTGGILLGIFFVSLMTFFHNLWIKAVDFGLKFEEIWNISVIFSENIAWKIIFNAALFFLFVLILKAVKGKYHSSQWD